MDIFGFFGTILTPIKWVIEAILVGFHWVFSNVFHMDPAAGFTWVLSIVCLVLVVRAALIPIIWTRGSNSCDKLPFSFTVNLGHKIAS